MAPNVILKNQNTNCSQVQNIQNRIELKKYPKIKHLILNHQIQIHNCHHFLIVLHYIKNLLGWASDFKVSGNTCLSLAEGFAGLYFYYFLVTSARHLWPSPNWQKRCSPWWCLGEAITSHGVLASNGVSS